jgi:hypothetical protein
MEDGHEDQVIDPIEKQGLLWRNPCFLENACVFPCFTVGATIGRPLQIKIPKRKPSDGVGGGLLPPKA